MSGVDRVLAAGVIVDLRCADAALPVAPAPPDPPGRPGMGGRQ